MHRPVCRHIGVRGEGAIASCSNHAPACLPGPARDIPPPPHLAIQTISQNRSRPGNRVCSRLAAVSAGRPPWETSGAAVRRSERGRIELRTSWKSRLRIDANHESLRRKGRLGSKLTYPSEMAMLVQGQLSEGFRHVFLFSA